MTTTLVRSPPGAAVLSRPQLPEPVERLIGHPDATWAPPTTLDKAMLPAVQQAIGSLEAGLRGTSERWIVDQLARLAAHLAPDRSQENPFDEQRWTIRMTDTAAALKSYPPDLLRDAFDELVRTCKWWPKIVEIAALLDGHLSARRVLLARCRQLVPACGSPPVAAPVSDEERRRTGEMLGRLARWNRRRPAGYAGPVASAADFGSDEAYQAFLTLAEPHLKPARDKEAPAVFKEPLPLLAAGEMPEPERMRRAYAAGAKAALDDVGAEANTHAPGTAEHAAWNEGHETERRKRL